jgi:hypothetical protein
MVDELNIFATGWENSKRKIRLKKASEAYTIYKQLSQYYPVFCLLAYYPDTDFSDMRFLKELTSNLPSPKRWVNLGGQLVQETSLDQIIEEVKHGGIKSWKALHDYYKYLGNGYGKAKTQHAFAIAFSDQGLASVGFTKSHFREMLEGSKSFRKWMSERIYKSRKKDYDNPFRNMVYASEKERDQVLGALETNSFIQAERSETIKFVHQIDGILKSLE